MGEKNRRSKSAICELGNKRVMISSDMLRAAYKNVSTTWHISININAGRG
jgi:hypothetical protein